MNRADAEKAFPDASSMPEFTVMDVYHVVSVITDSGVSALLKSTVHSAVAEKAFPAVSSTPESTVVDVYSSVSAPTDSGSQRT